jgi:hypothetical protein
MNSVSPEGITSDPEKMKAVREWPTPKNKHEIRSFLGIGTYFRLFISGFANIARPLTKLTEENQAFQSYYSPLDSHTRAYGTYPDELISSTSLVSPSDQNFTTSSYSSITAV